MNAFQLLLAFLEGVAVILSPCIWPILPFVLATSVEGGRRRPLGIISGFVMAFSVFSLSSRALVSLLAINLDDIKYGSLSILALFGLMLLSERALQAFTRLTQGLANSGGRLLTRASHGYFSGVCLGVLIGLVWTPCAGPILAVALVEIIREQDNVNAVRLIIAFALGAGVPMLIIALVGRQYLSAVSVLQRHASVIHKSLGLLVLASVWLLVQGVDFAFWPSPFQESLSTLAKQQQYSFDAPYPAPVIASSDTWLNTPDQQAISLASLKGKVVLVDFWTYSCINCLRTLPHLKAWYEKYHAQGLEIIGVHAPEFEFEKNPNNVLQAIARYAIPYPVVMDNQLDTWTNFHNQYWPAHYLIDQKGNVVYSHIGEGQYGTMENNIRLLLGLKVDDHLGLAEALPTHQTPETYLGFKRAKTFSSPELVVPNQPAVYHLPAELPLHHWALAGSWTVESERIVSQVAMGQLQLHFKAQKVYLVLGSATGKPIPVQLRLNGKVVEVGTGVSNGQLVVDQHRLYELVNQSQTQEGVLDIIAAKPGLTAYAFTFG